MGKGNQGSREEKTDSLNSDLPFVSVRRNFLPSQSGKGVEAEGGRRLMRGQISLKLERGLSRFGGGQNRGRVLFVPIG
jgi:hypothetical protein